MGSLPAGYIILAYAHAAGDNAVVRDTHDRQWGPFVRRDGVLCGFVRLNIVNAVVAMHFNSESDDFCGLQLSPTVSYRHYIIASRSVAARS